MKAYKRIQKSSMNRTNVPSFVLGNRESDIRFTLYANPVSETCNQLIGNDFNSIKRDMLTGERAVGLQIVFVAPEMQSWASQLSFDTIRAAKCIVGKDSISATDVSEASCAIQHTESEDVLIDFLKNIYKTNVEKITYDRLFEIVSEANADETYVKDAIETGKYRPVIRQSTEQWVWMIPDDQGVENPYEAVMYINGVWIPDCTVETMRDNIVAGRRLMDEEIELPEEMRKSLFGNEDVSIQDLR